MRGGSNRTWLGFNFLIATVVALIATVAGAFANLISGSQDMSRATIAIVAVTVSALGAIVSVIVAVQARRQASEARDMAALAEYQADLLSRRLQLEDDGSARLEFGPEEATTAIELLAGDTRMNPAALMVVMEWAAVEKRLRSAVQSKTGDDMTGLPVSRLMRRYAEISNLASTEQDKLRQSLDIRNKCVHGLTESVSPSALQDARSTLEDFLKRTEDQADA